MLQDDSECPDVDAAELDIDARAEDCAPREVVAKWDADSEAAPHLQMSDLAIEVGKLFEESWVDEPLFQLGQAEHALNIDGADAGSMRTSASGGNEEETVPGTPDFLADSKMVAMMAAAGTSFHLVGCTGGPDPLDGNLLLPVTCAIAYIAFVFF